MMAHDAYKLQERALRHYSVSELRLVEAYVLTKVTGMARKLAVWRADLREIRSELHRYGLAPEGGADD